VGNCRAGAAESVEPYAMSLGCAKGCGRCCNPVHLTPAQDAIVQNWVAYIGNGGDRPEDGTDADFILKHMTRISDADSGGGRYICAMYDVHRRLCRAHDQRPRMCSEYPWYDSTPDASVIDGSCSYMLDVEPSQRPAGSRPLIPVEVLR
jgi:Fe-S-cluster containining protein